MKKVIILLSILALPGFASVSSAMEEIWNMKLFIDEQYDILQNKKLSDIFRNRQYKKIYSGSEQIDAAEIIETSWEDDILKIKAAIRGNTNSIVTFFIQKKNNKALIIKIEAENPANGVITSHTQYNEKFFYLAQYIFAIEK
jgi:hypothetical protein